MSNTPHVLLKGQGPAKCVARAGMRFEKLPRRHPGHSCGQLAPGTRHACGRIRCSRRWAGSARHIDRLMGLHSITASRAAARRPRFCVAAIRVVRYHAHFDQLYGYGVARKHGTRQRAPEFMFTPPPVDAFHISYRTTPLTTTYGSCFLSRPPADGWR